MYIRFEACLLPISLIIGLWGYQPERFSASFYLLVYGIFRGLPILLVLATSIEPRGPIQLRILSSPLIFWACSIGFIVKTPLFLFHVWLPKAHVEAPTLGSIVLAGVLLKLGSYGVLIFLFSIKFIFSGIYFFISSFGTAVSVFYVLLRTDIKAWVALSSVVHINAIVAIIFTFFSGGKETSIFSMVFHGVVSSGIFFICGFLIHMFLDRSCFLLGELGFQDRLLFLFFTISNIDVPPFIRSVAEVFMLGCLFSLHFFLGMFWGVVLLGIIYYCVFLQQHVLKEATTYVVFSSSGAFNLLIFLCFILNFFLLGWLF